VTDRYPRKLLRHYYAAYERASSAAIYPAWRGDVDGTADATETFSIIMPYAGRVLKAILQSNDTTAGVTTLNACLDEADGDAADATANISVADTNYTFTWANTTFTAGQKLGLKVTPTGNHAEMQVTLMVELEPTDWNGG